MSLDLFVIIEITRVIFDPTEEKPKKHKNKMRYNMSHQYQAKGSTKLSNQFIHNALNHKGETEMWCMRNDYVIVAMFISAHEYKVRDWNLSYRNSINMRLLCFSQITSLASFIITPKSPSYSQNLFFAFSGKSSNPSQ